MRLFIDTTNSENIKVQAGDILIEESSRDKKSQALLHSIEVALLKNKKSLTGIKEIEVKVGPGSFTGLKVGISVANALGWALGVCVNGKDVVEDGPVEPQY